MAYYHESHHVARPQGALCRTVFASIEYDADDPPEAITVGGERWVRPSDVGAEEIVSSLLLGKMTASEAIAAIEGRA